MAMNYSAKEEADGLPGSSSSSVPGGGGGVSGSSSVVGGALKSRKPDNTAFKQQRLPAWQPILTAGTVLPAFFVIGLIFIPIGIGIFVTSNNIREHEIDYTGTEPGSPCHKCLNVSWNSAPCHCIINFTLDQPFESNVFMYYGLSNFYQNHRRYVKSRDDSQLNGNKKSLLNPSKECDPYLTSGDKPIAPCGAIANSMFNDTLTLYRIDQNGSHHIPLNKKGIAWWTDKYVKFRNPVGDDNNLTVLFHGKIVTMAAQPEGIVVFAVEKNLVHFEGNWLVENCVQRLGTAKPVNWPKPVYMLDSDPDNNGFINEDFIVWMRTAALPTFRKLYRIIERKDNLLPALSAGPYSLDITYNFPVHSFDGRKRMILSTISWMGGKNPFLGIAYITVGSICFFLGVVLLIIHHKYGNRNNSADIPN